MHLASSERWRRRSYLWRVRGWDGHLRLETRLRLFRCSLLIVVFFDGLVIARKSSQQQFEEPVKIDSQGILCFETRYFALNISVHPINPYQIYIDRQVSFTKIWYFRKYFICFACLPGSAAIVNKICGFPFQRSTREHRRAGERRGCQGPNPQLGRVAQEHQGLLPGTHSHANSHPLPAHLAGQLIITPALDLGLRSVVKTARGNCSLCLEGMFAQVNQVLECNFTHFALETAESVSCGNNNVVKGNICTWCATFVPNWTLLVSWLNKISVKSVCAYFIKAESSLKIFQADCVVRVLVSCWHACKYERSAFPLHLPRSIFRLITFFVKTFPPQWAWPYWNCSQNLISCAEIFWKPDSSVPTIEKSGHFPRMNGHWQMTVYQCFVLHNACDLVMSVVKIVQRWQFEK